LWKKHKNTFAQINSLLYKGSSAVLWFHQESCSPSSVAFWILGDYEVLEVLQISVLVRLKHLIYAYKRCHDWNTKGLFVLLGGFNTKLGEILTKPNVGLKT